MPTVGDIRDSIGIAIGPHASSTVIQNLAQPLLDEAPPPPSLEEALARLEEMPTDPSPPDHHALPTGSRMMHTPNPAFVGREEELVALALDLKQGRASAIGQVAAASGLGGIGKTQLAAEFAHRYGRYFLGGVYWLSIADSAAVPSEIAASGFGMAGRPRSFHSLSPEEQVRWVRAQWQSELPRLLIFDNCEEPALLKAWRPTSGGARLLMTTRRSVWPQVAGVALLPLAKLPRHQSIALLRRFRAELAAEAPVLDAIADTLGDLPLALHLAGSYLRRYIDIPTGDPVIYLEALEEQVLAHRSMLEGEETATDHVPSVAATFALSVDQLDEQEEAGLWARALLARATHFAPGEPLPRRLLLATLPTAEPEAAADGLRRLLEVGLLMPESAGSVTIHRLVAHYASQRFPNEQALADVEQAVNRAAVQANATGLPSGFKLCLPHLRHVTERAVARNNSWSAALATNLGHYLITIGMYWEAREFLEYAVRRRRKELGELHLDVAQSLNNLGACYEKIGWRGYAESSYKEALTILEIMVGPNDLQTAHILANLGHLYLRWRQYGRARPLLNRAYNIRRAIFGIKHKDTLQSAVSLAKLWRKLGDYEKAERFLVGNLKIAEIILGEGHPDVADILNELALMYSDQGRYLDAESFSVRAVRIFTDAMGSEHPHTKIAIATLASVRSNQEE